MTLRVDKGLSINNIAPVNLILTCNSISAKNIQAIHRIYTFDAKFSLQNSNDRKT